MTVNLESHTSSFRDPAGFIFEHQGTIYRQINLAGKDDFEFTISSGLYKALTSENLMVAHEKVDKPIGITKSSLRYKIIKPQRVPFVSYPYEWSFSQLKDAALLTLKIQKIALQHGMILKDASSYNIQFIGKKPIFIDTLSFRIYKTGSPWDGYRQFCQHFIAPLALASYSAPEVIRSLSVFLDGMPLGLVTNLLPSRARARWGLLTHLYMHSASQRRFDNPSSKTSEPKTRKISPTAMQGLISSLENATRSLKPRQHRTQWSNYYEDTNYSERAFESKKEIVKSMLGNISPTPELVWDLGANDGTFSLLAAGIGAYTIAFDIDYQAIENNYRADSAYDNQLLPLMQDLSNPSPDLGWAHAERASLERRGPADVVLALALIHHLVITNTLPFSNIASYFKSIARYLIIEFVPKGDSKVDLLLRGRLNEMFSEYDIEHFEAAFEKYFNQVEKKELPESKRVIYLYKAKES